MSLQITTLKRKKPSEIVCLFCDSTVNLVKEPRKESFTTIKNAGNRRKDEINEKFLKFYNPYSTTQCFSWHRNCMATYVSEEKIRRREIFLYNEQSDSTSHVDLNVVINNNEPFIVSGENEEKVNCFICNCVTKNKDKRLILCSEIASAKKIFDIALKKKDHIFLEISSCSTPEDLFARKVKYHKNCYKEYIRIPKSSSNKEGRPSTKVPEDILNCAFDKLIDEMKDQFSTTSFELSYLAIRLSELTEIENATIENRDVKSLFINKYGDKVLFSYPSDKSKSSTLFMSNVPLVEVVERVRELNSENHIVTCAKELRKELLKTTLIPDDYLCDEVLLEKLFAEEKLPSIWKIFLQALFSSKNQTLGESTYRRAYSVFSDIFFTVTDKQTPKHIAVAQSIHHLSRSKHLITVLNKLGHCISYKSLKNIDFELTSSILSEDNKQQILIPKNILKDPSLFLHGAIDNNDFNEETLSGQGSTHVTAMVIYQEESFEENNIPLVTTKPTDKQVNLNFKSLNCQDVLYYKPIENLSVLNYVESSCLLPCSQNNIQKINFLWILCRLQYYALENDFFRPSVNAIPGWTSFQQLLTTQYLPISTVGFCPVIPHPPTSKDVVYTAMTNFVKMYLSLEKSAAVLSCDMAIYLIAKDIQLRSNEFQGLTLRIGTFHLQKNFLRCLGQFIEGSGLDNILIEANIYGTNTLSTILSGTQYNRGIRAHKLIYESLRSFQFFEFIDKSGFSEDELKYLNMCLQEIRERTVDKDHSSVIDKYTKFERTIENFFLKFLDFLNRKSIENETFCYLNNYCQMVEILLNSIAADRLGDFDLHLQSTREMLPFLFSMNHTNYVRGVTLYLQDMMKLPTEMVYELKRGMMSVKRGDGKFNAVGCDLALEQTQNRSSAVSGGLIGITQSKDAMQRWLLLYPVKNSIHSALLSYLGMQSDAAGDIHSNFHSEWSQSRMDKDEMDIKNLITCLKECNIFQTTEECGLHNIYTGAIAEESTKCLLSLKEDGESLIKQFESERFQFKTKSVFDPLKRVPFHNFTYNSKQKAATTDNKKLTDSKDITNVQQSFMLASQRGFDRKILSSYEILDYCKYLFTEDGLYRKSPKATLALEIENNHNCAIESLSNISSLNSSKIYIVDGMSLVHKIQLKKFISFGDFAQAYFSTILLLHSPDVNRIDVVFDRYDNLSIKFLESELRSKGQHVKKMIILNNSTKIPVDTKSFFASSENKLQLVKFLCKYALKEVKIQENRELYISGGFDDPTKCYKLQSNSISEIFALKSNHLEADSRMFSHIFHAADTQNAHIIILSADTDVFILGIYFWQKLYIIGCQGLWFEGSQKKKRYLGCHLAAESLGDNVSKILPALHSLTGCDTTSRLGNKKNCLKSATLDFIQARLLNFGDEFLDFEKFSNVEKVCTYLYSQKEITADEIRHKLISQNIGFGLNLSRIICTSNALYLHCLRASAQTYLWKNAFQPLIEPIDFLQFGYELRDSNLYPIQMTKPSLPELLIKPCKCYSNCKTMSCSCKKSGLVCISLCKCVNSDCNNLNNNM
ncbi:uncharacterized protein LOC122510010 [Leptopilina heterotoma]|uniref:uncharacterized protein LOC122510010 n=1 Tax=Leptopilina heterotoma TaxID=63436 RepID=UPI001CA7E594|nr:uncharacterized protein LOC122510010 [Leptopilina heterotoma]